MKGVRLNHRRSWVAAVMAKAEVIPVGDYFGAVTKNEFAPHWVASVNIPVSNFDVPVAHAKVTAEGATKQQALMGLMVKLRRIRASGNLRALEGFEFRLL